MNKAKAFQDEGGICQYLREGSMEREETKGAREDRHSSLKPSQVRKGQNFRPKIFSPRERICYSGESMSIGVTTLHPNSGIS